MYEQNITDDFKQGDIFNNFNKVNVNVQKQKEGDRIDINTSIDKCKVIILSHSCDVTKTNSSSKRTRMLVGKISIVDERILKKYNDDIENLLNKPHTEGEDKGYHQLNLFYLAPHKKLDNKPHKVYFDKMFSIPRTRLRLKDKILELKEENREQLQMKLVANFYLRGKEKESRDIEQ